MLSKHFYMTLFFVYYIWSMSLSVLLKNIFNGFLLQYVFLLVSVFSFFKNKILGLDAKVGILEARARVGWLLAVYFCVHTFTIVRSVFLSTNAFLMLSNFITGF